MTLHISLSASCSWFLIVCLSVYLRNSFRLENRHVRALLWSPGAFWEWNVQRLPSVSARRDRDRKSNCALTVRSDKIAIDWLRVIDLDRIAVSLSAWASKSVTPQNHSIAFGSACLPVCASLSVYFCEYYCSWLNVYWKLCAPKDGRQTAGLHSKRLLGLISSIIWISHSLFECQHVSNTLSLIRIPLADLKVGW